MFKNSALLLTGFPSERRDPVWRATADLKGMPGTESDRPLECMLGTGTRVHKDRNQCSMSILRTEESRQMRLRSPAARAGEAKENHEQDHKKRENHRGWPGKKSRPV